MEHPMHQQMQHQMQQPVNNQMQSQEQTQMPPEVQNIEYNTNESKIEGLLNKLKKPILIASILCTE